jgi:hypothetical protein
MKTLILALIFISKSAFSFGSPTVLSPGDLAIISFNFEDPDCFSFVTLVDLEPGTIIYFTDCGWKEDNTFRPGEGLITYVVPDPGKQAMSVLSYPVDPGFTTQGISGFFGFAEAGDQILVFQGSFADPIFIFAINNSSTSWQPSAIDNNSSFLPSGLTNLVSALALNEKINYEYNCFLSTGTKEEIFASIVNPDNWIGSNSARVTIPSNCFREALPVTFVSLKAIPQGDRTTIQFIVSEEMNIEQYQIQRSEDGSIFTTLAVIPSENISGMRTYAFMDPAAGNFYYRIQAIETNGHSFFSAATYKEGIEDSRFNSYMIITLNGQLLLHEENSAISEEDLLLKLNEFFPGLYIMRITSQSSVRSKFVVIE